MAARGAPRIAVVGYAQTPMVRLSEEAEVKLVQDVVIAALKNAGVGRHEVGFTCSGSCDYLSGGTFTFVANLDAVGAWPPIHESHVEMDGAWALYEAWVRLQHGDIDTALVFGSGKSSTGDLTRSCRCRSTRTTWQPWAGSDHAGRAAGPRRARRAATPPSATLPKWRRAAAPRREQPLRPGDGDRRR